MFFLRFFSPSHYQPPSAELKPPNLNTYTHSVYTAYAHVCTLRFQENGTVAPSAHKPHTCIPTHLHTFSFGASDFLVFGENKTRLILQVTLESIRILLDETNWLSALYDTLFWCKHTYDLVSLIVQLPEPDKNDKNQISQWFHSVSPFQFKWLANLVIC